MNTSPSAVTTEPLLPILYCQNLFLYNRFNIIPPLHLGHTNDPFLHIHIHTYTNISCYHFCHMSAYFLVSLIPPNSKALTIFGEEYSLWRSQLFKCLHYSVMFFPLGRNLLHCTLLLSALIGYFFFNMRDEPSYQYKTTGKNIILYIIILHEE
jgi:hypothetical protein